MTQAPRRPAASGRRIALLAFTAIATLSGCHVTVNGGSESSPTTATTTTAPQAAVPRSDLEQITGQQVREQSGGGPVVITCPNDLPIELGAKVKCALAQDSKRFEITITITEARSANDAKWSWEVGRQLPATDAKAQR
ncbi:DUF4333 domain-containing protein [Mycolicibacterium neoaurum]|uniref:DUF4333 domain-containing protein n=1 Tax=Mycolicibacterium neoaurum TaxID=1795 RepID=UPI001F4D2D99|nr:DUF4333 domain-containing protein [Mycolicibacterium neoaurum]